MLNLALMPKHLRPRLKTKPCPRCGELFSPQGLWGHLRITHKLDSDEARQGMVEANQLPEVVPDPEADLPALPIGLAVAGTVLVLGVLFALYDRNTVGCTHCGTKLNVSGAREVGAAVVNCPKCGALVQLP